MRGKSDEEQRINKIIGRNLKRIRKERGMSLQGVAKILNVSYQQVQKYESGGNRISADRLYQFSSIFYVPLTNFYVGV